MAKKTLEQHGKSVAKKAVKKGAKKAARNASKELKGEVKTKRIKRGFFGKVLPYVFLLYAVILLIFYILVHIADADAGWIGDFIQPLNDGMFGAVSFLAPLVLGFFSIKWIVYTVRWKDGEDGGAEYAKARKRIVVQGIMSFLTVVMIASMAGIFAGYDAREVFSLEQMWGEGTELTGGGLFGSALAALFVACVTTVPAVIIVTVLIFIFGMLMIGIPLSAIPNLIVSKSKEASDRRREDRAIRKEEQRIANEEAREAEKQARAAAFAASRQQKVAPEPQSTKAQAAYEPTVTEDYFPDSNNGEELKPVSIESIIAQNSAPAEKQTAEKTFDPVKDIFEEEKEEEPTAPDNENGGDFGGEPGFDTDEFDAIDDIIQGIDTSTGEVTDEELVEASVPKVEESKTETIGLSAMDNNELLSDMAAVAPDEGEEETEEEENLAPYVFPPIDMLSKNKNAVDNNYNEELRETAHILRSTLSSFRINVKEDITYSRGPTITRYELKPEAGVRVRSIANLVDDISLSLASSGVRIEAPIPGKAAVGIEVPNRTRATVYLRDLIENHQFTDAKSKLTAALGMDVGGNPIYFDISKMPHMLIAGATGMGKSVCINCVIISLLYKARPEDLKLILIDPKKVEFNIYKDIPHLYAPIVSDPKKAAGALASAVAEMERRFELIEEVGVRDIASYNAATENDPYKEHMPHMVIIIDELADLMMTAPDEVETAICRLAQKARAAGIHIIIGTQRPSVDVITGLIKANIPSRIACTVASQVDSRTIIDIAGAEKLIGRGDMLFAPVGAAKPLRVQGAFVTDSEVENICTFVRENNAKAKYNAEFINRIEEEAAKCGMKKGAVPMNAEGEPIGGGDDGGDSKFHAAVKLAVETGKISTSLMQRKLGVGYGRAAKIIDTMEEMGYVSKADGTKPRAVLITPEEYARRVAEGTLGNADE